MTASDATIELSSKLAAAALNAEFRRIASDREFAELEALRRLELRPNGNLLVIGGGPAVLIEAAKRLSCERIVAMEPGAAELSRVRDATLRQEGCAAIEWRDALLHDPPLPASHFDGILVVESLTLLGDLEPRLARLRESLTRDGRVATLFDFYAENTATHPWRRQFDLPFRLHSVPGWARIFTAAGFDVTLQARVRADETSGLPAWRSIRGSLLFVLTSH